MLVSKKQPSIRVVTLYLIKGRGEVNETSSVLVERSPCLSPRNVLNDQMSHGKNPMHRHSTGDPVMGSYNVWYRQPHMCSSFGPIRSVIDLCTGRPFLLRTKHLQRT
jgi:hypothetical protein